MSEMKKGLQYAAFNFDVHDDKSLYAAVYKELGPHAIPNGSASSYLVLYAHKAQIENKIEQINFKAHAKGKRGVTYKIRRTHPDEADVVREDSINELHSHVAFITQSMLDRIDRLEKKFNAKVDDVNEMWQVMATLTEMKLNKEIEIQSPTIEDVFLKVVGGRITEEGELKQ